MVKKIPNGFQISIHTYFELYHLQVLCVPNILYSSVESFHILISVVIINVIII